MIETFQFDKFLQFFYAVLQAFEKILGGISINFFRQVCSSSLWWETLII